VKECFIQGRGWEFLWLAYSDLLWLTYFDSYSSCAESRDVNYLSFLNYNQRLTKPNPIPKVDEFSILEEGQKVLY